MRLKYKEPYGYDGVCDLKKYNNIVVCTHEKEGVATSIKSSAEYLMEYVIKRYDFDMCNLVWVNRDLWRRKDHYRLVNFEYKDGRCEILGNKIITIEELNEMVRKSGDYIC